MAATKKISETEVNQSLQRYSTLACIRVWRSVGSNVFFEYGMPKLRPVVTAKGNRKVAISGEITLSIHSEDWQVFSSNKPVLFSENVDNQYLRVTEENYFRNATLPIISFEGAGRLSLGFDDGLYINIGRTDYLDPADELDSELLITLPNNEYISFHFDRGFVFTREQ